MGENSNTTTVPSLSPTVSLILGAILAITIGLFAFLSHNFNIAVFGAFITAYGVTGSALAIYLIESSTTKYLKYVVLIIASGIAYGLSIWLNADLISITAMAAFIVTLGTFVLDELQQYAPNLPTQVVNDGTLIIAGVVSIATAVSTAAPGTIINVQTLLPVVVASLFAYLIQVYTPGATPPTSSSLNPPTGAASTPASSVGGHQS
jgi:hypothetical protein